MIKQIDLQDAACVKELLQIQKQAYQLEAELIGYEHIPPMFDTPDTLQESGETFYGYFHEGALHGVIAFKIEDNVLDIYRLFVHPEQLRKGIAGKLLNYAENHCTDARKIIVTAAEKNAPAIRLYEKNGFKSCGRKKVDEKLTLIDYEKIR